MALASRVEIDARVVELGRDRVRVRSPDGRLVRSFGVQGAIRHDLCRFAAGCVVFPTHGLRLYRFRARDDRLDSGPLPQAPREVWLRRGRALAVGRDRATVFGEEPFVELLAIRTQGRIDVSATAVSWPVAAIVSVRELHVVDLSGCRSRRVPAGSRIGAVRVHRGVVVTVERDRVVLVDGASLEPAGRLDTRQRLRPETLRVGTGIAAVATRDTVVVADLERRSIVQVGVGDAVESVRLAGGVVTVRGRAGGCRLGPDGRLLREGGPFR